MTEPDLSTWISGHAALRPDAIAIRFEGREFSYAALHERVSRLAGGLAGELGVRKGDRVAFLGLNSADEIVLLFACARLGALFLPLNWRLATPEHAYQLENAGARLLFFEESMRAGAETLAKALPLRLVTTPDELATLAERGEAQERSSGSGSDPLLLVYTSGTTGRPKGAVLSQSALDWNARNSAAMHDLVEVDHILTTLPLFHVGGLNIQTTPALRAGACITIHRGFEPGAVLASIERDRPTLTVLVPAQMQAVTRHAKWDATDLTSLRCLTSGSTLVPAPLIEAFHARGVPVIQVYGSTETAPVAIYQRRADAFDAPGSVGRPAAHCEIRLIDDKGRDIIGAAPGEILVRGPNLMSHYWNDTAATESALRGGWYHTGDVGSRDETGSYWIVDRIKDVLISGSENVYPAEIEAVLARHPAIAEIAVVGRPDERWGEVPIAFAIAHPGSGLTIDDVRAWCEGHLARFKHPHALRLVDELPRNAMGKVRKDALRERALLP